MVGTDEFFLNDFVVKVESGHMGYIEYRLIATRKSWRVLAAQLTEALEKTESAEPSGEALLLQKYATVSQGKTARVYLSFYKANDLAAHHVQPSSGQIWKSNLTFALLVLVALLILGLAGVGAAKLVGDFAKGVIA